MPTVNLKRQKAARAILDKIFADPASFWVIHYSCESFYDRPQGRSPRITSIALRKLDSGQTTSFSIHKIAETQGVAFDQIEDSYDRLEKDTLREFLAHLKNFQQMQFIHWNMRDGNYGFQAIEHRFRVLGGQDTESYIVDDNNKIDLARVLIDIYGRGYVGHPRLPNLLKLNHIAALDFLTGEKEARAFEAKDFVGLHQSTLRKVDVIANIASRAQERNLKTKTNWWAMHGGHFTAIGTWLMAHPLLAAGGSLASIFGVIVFVTCR